MNFARKTFALAFAVLSLAALPGAAGAPPEGGMPLEADRAEAAAPKAPHELVMTDDMMIAWLGEDSPKHLKKFLVSKKCAPSRVSMAKEINAVLRLGGPEKLVEYACGDAEHNEEIRKGLKKLKERAIQKKFEKMKKQRFKQVVAKNVNCKLATQMKVYEEIQMLEEVAGSRKLCKEKMEWALAAVEDDSTRRALLGGQEERHLAICGGACVVLVVVFLLGFSTNAY